MQGEGKARPLLVVLAVLVIGANASAQADETALVTDPNELRWDLTETFGITLDRVAVTSRYDVSEVDRPLDCNTSERVLTLSLRFDIADANRPVGVDTNPPVVLGVLGDVGQIVDCQVARSRGVREYEELPWDFVWVDEDVGYANKLLPSGRTLELVLDPNEPVPPCLSRVEGYVCVLYAEEIIEADVAYEIDAEWVDPTGDLHVTVRPQTPPTPGPIEFEAIPGVPRGGGMRPTAPVALWKYKTRVSSDAGNVLPLGRAWGLGPSIEDYVVIRTELIEVKESVTFIHEVRDQWNGFGYLNDCFCSGEFEQDYSDFDSIRHVIAVHPVEVRIPFVLTDIPVPTF